LAAGKLLGRRKQDTAFTPLNPRVVLSGQELRQLVDEVYVDVLVETCPVGGKHRFPPGLQEFFEKKEAPGSWAGPAREKLPVTKRIRLFH
jgi:hypothetical protein